MQRKRFQRGSLMLDRKTQTWFFRYYRQGQRKVIRLGTRKELPSRARAELAAEPFRSDINNHPSLNQIPLVSALWDRYRAERMPSRSSTQRGIISRMENHVLPRWGNVPIQDVHPRDVELWLEGLQLAPKTRTHIRSLLAALFDYAMWAKLIPVSPNPMSLVAIRQASQRTRKPHILTVEEFQRLAAQLPEPYKTLAIVQASLGLRISEALGLQWGDVQWITKELRLQRAVVKQETGAVKTIHSAKPLPLDSLILDVLKQHRQRSEFTGETDWIFAGPGSLGRLPYAYTCIFEQLAKAAKKAGIPHVSTHSFRHSYRTWLNEAGTPVSVQQRAMRHSDIRTTMNIYGDLIGNELRSANAEVVSRVIRQ